MVFFFCDIRLSNIKHGQYRVTQRTWSDSSSRMQRQQQQAPRGAPTLVLPITQGLTPQQARARLESLAEKQREQAVPDVLPWPASFATGVVPTKYLPGRFALPVQTEDIASMGIPASKASQLEGYEPDPGTADQLDLWRFDPFTGYFLNSQTGERLGSSAFRSRFYSQHKRREGCERVQVPDTVAPVLPPSGSDLSKISAVITVLPTDQDEAPVVVPLEGLPPNATASDIAALLQDKIGTRVPLSSVRLIAYNPLSYDIENHRPLWHATYTDMSSVPGYTVGRAYAAVGGTSTISPSGQRLFETALPIVVVPVQRPEDRLGRLRLGQLKRQMAALLFNTDVPFADLSPQQRLLATDVASGVLRQMNQQAMVYQGYTPSERAAVWGSTTGTPSPSQPGPSRKRPTPPEEDEVAIENFLSTILRLYESYFVREQPGVTDRIQQTVQYVVDRILTSPFGGPDYADAYKQFRKDRMSAWAQDPERTASWVRFFAWLDSYIDRAQAVASEMHASRVLIPTFTPNEGITLQSELRGGDEYADVSPDEAVDLLAAALEQGAQEPVQAQETRRQVQCDVCKKWRAVSSAPMVQRFVRSITDENGARTDVSVRTSELGFELLHKGADVTYLVPITDEYIVARNVDETQPSVAAIPGFAKGYDASSRSWFVNTFGVITEGTERGTLEAELVTDPDSVLVFLFADTSVYGIKRIYLDGSIAVSIVNNTLGLQAPGERIVPNGTALRYYYRDDETNEIRYFPLSDLIEWSNLTWQCGDPGMEAINPQMKPVLREMRDLEMALTSEEGDYTNTERRDMDRRLSELREVLHRERQETDEEYAGRSQPGVRAAVASQATLDYEAMLEAEEARQLEEEERQQAGGAGYFVSREAPELEGAPAENIFQRVVTKRQRQSIARGEESRKNESLARVYGPVETISETDSEGEGSMSEPETTPRSRATRNKTPSAGVRRSTVPVGGPAGATPGSTIIDRARRIIDSQPAGIYIDTLVDMLYPQNLDPLEPGKHIDESQFARKKKTVTSELAKLSSSKRSPRYFVKALAWPDSKGFGWFISRDVLANALPDDIDSMVRTITEHFSRRKSTLFDPVFLRNYLSEESNLARKERSEAAAASTGNIATSATVSNAGNATPTKRSRVPASVPPISTSFSTTSLVPLANELNDAFRAAVPDASVPEPFDMASLRRILSDATSVSTEDYGSMSMAQSIAESMMRNLAQRYASLSLAGRRSDMSDLISTLEDLRRRELDARFKTTSLLEGGEIYPPSITNAGPLPLY